MDRMLERVSNKMLKLSIRNMRVEIRAELEREATQGQAAGEWPTIFQPRAGK